MKSLLQSLGLKTFFIILTDVMLISISLFTGILSALAYDKEPWGTKFWTLALISIFCDIITSVIGWWSWLEIRKHQ